jgi:hypothetical protein
MKEFKAVFFDVDGNECATCILLAQDLKTARTKAMYGNYMKLEGVDYCEVREVTA